MALTTAAAVSLRTRSRCPPPSFAARIVLHQLIPASFPSASIHFCPLTALAFMQFCFWRVIDFMLLLLMVFFLWFKLISIMHKYGKPAICPALPQRCPATALPCPALSTYPQLCSPLFKSCVCWSCLGIFSLTLNIFFPFLSLWFQSRWRRRRPHRPPVAFFICIWSTYIYHTIYKVFFIIARLFIQFMRKNLYYVCNLLHFRWKMLQVKTKFLLILMFCQSNRPPSFPSCCAAWVFAVDLLINNFMPKWGGGKLAGSA